MIKFINRFILLRNMHLQSRLIIYFMILMIIPFYVVSSVVYYSAERTIQKNVSEFTASKLEQAINSVDLYIENADSVLQSIFFDSNLRQYIYDSRKSDYDRTIALSEVSKILSGYIYPTKYVGQIYIADLHDNIFASGSMMLDILKEEDWFQHFEEGNDKVAIIPTHNAGKYIVRLNDNIDTVITVLRKYTNIEVNEPLGIIGIDINYQYIHNVFQNTDINQDITTLMITENGEIVYNKDKSLVGNEIETDVYQQVFQNKSGSYSQKIDGTSYFVVYTTSKKTNWKLIQQIPVESLFAEARSIKTEILVVGIICSLFASMIAVVASYGVSAPLKRLRNEMAKVERGDLTVHIETANKDEVGELSNSFNRMVKELSASITRIYEDENIKKQIELNMLQQQINPHFLYNTLDSISWMARMHNAPNISTTITSLVKLLQASTYTNRDFVTVEEELENIKNYIAIQKFRYGNLFDVNYEIEEAILTKYTLKLILQPLVENAINHGLEDMTEGGMITVGGKMQDNTIHLWVEDNGIGIDQTKIEQILTKDMKESSRYNSIGISNTAKRIKLYYGDAYGLEFDRTKEKGTKVIISIPVRTEERLKLDDQSDNSR